MVNERRWGLIDALYHEDALLHVPLETAPRRGRQAVRELHEQQASAVPDLEMTIVEMAVEADRAAVRCTLKGTHRGMLGGFPPSGRSFAGVEDARWYRFVDGRVAEVWILPTTALMLEKLRLVPTGPPPRLLVWLVGLKLKLGARQSPASPFSLPPLVEVEPIPGEHGAAQKFLVRRGLLELFGARRFDLYDALYPADYRVVSKVDDVTGKAAVLGLFRKVLGSFPDLHFTILDMVAEGDLVGILVTARGTQLGPIEGFPPTGKRYEATELFMCVVRDDRLRRMWHFVNFEAILQQTGLAPPGPPPLPLRLLMRFLASRQSVPVVSAT
jgi:steroid delta-isomerase-like uncharacterized protein